VTDERLGGCDDAASGEGLGSPEIVVYAVQSFIPGTLLTTEACAFEEAWRGNCYGAFLVSREVARRMVKLGRGSILLAGATSGTKGRKGYINLAVGKFGLRALAQVMASELGPQGVHVAHVVIDGGIRESGEPVPDRKLSRSNQRKPFSCCTVNREAAGRLRSIFGHRLRYFGSTVRGAFGEFSAKRPFRIDKNFAY
jgi:NAD(P)-dependent dehydrogenase (short-subunit alcohol dehydrogenase family)